MRHELWQEPDGQFTFCLAGPRGDNARALLGAAARLVWQVEAGNHLEAMQRYYAHMGWGDYHSAEPALDARPYPLDDA
ncbi:MAG: hypothetical protein GAK45_01898 [Pseudomonas citronellolis]|nr:MAG: hypothetical protein GAK45_01898 [Pseudomonas citronellolis]